jgi:hypothetical protein
MTDFNQQDEKLSALYKEGGDAEPPVHLDQSVLAASKKKTGSRSRSIPVKPDYWKLPAALASMAAVVVLSLLIVPLMLDKTQHEDTPDYRFNRTENFEVMEEEIQSAPVVSSPAVPQRAPMADKLEQKNSAAAKSKLQQEPRTRIDKEAGGAEADSNNDGLLLKAPAGFAASVAPKIPAEQWMKSIMQLSADGHYQQALDELALFREAYPDYAVDESFIHTLKGKIESIPSLPDAVK